MKSWQYSIEGLTVKDVEYILEHLEKKGYKWKGCANLGLDPYTELEIKEGEYKYIRYDSIEDDIYLSDLLADHFPVRVGIEDIPTYESASSDEPEKCPDCTNASRKCTCEILTLMRSGCQCGGE